MERSEIEKPHWMKLHEWFVQDFIFYSQEKVFFKDMAVKNPGVKMWHKVIKSINDLIKREQKKYRKEYGEPFKMSNLETSTLIEWIEKSGYKPSVWEDKFMKDVSSQGYALSPKQKECLQRIYEKSSNGEIYQDREVI